VAQLLTRVRRRSRFPLIWPAVLAADPVAKRHVRQAERRPNRYAILYRVTTAKQADTRRRRIGAISFAMLARGEGPSTRNRSLRPAVNLTRKRAFAERVQRGTHFGRIESQLRSRRSPKGNRIVEKPTKQFHQGEALPLYEQAQKPAQKRRTHAHEARNSSRSTPERPEDRDNGFFVVDVGAGGRRGNRPARCCAAGFATKKKAQEELEIVRGQRPQRKQLHCSSQTEP